MFETKPKLLKHQCREAFNEDVMFETKPKLLKHQCREAFNEDVCKPRSNPDMKNPHISDSNLLTNEMEVKLNMIRTLMLDGVGGEVNGVDIVTVHESAS
jgi:hypothetical protein